MAVEGGGFLGPADPFPGPPRPYQLSVAGDGSVVDGTPTTDRPPTLDPHHLFISGGNLYDS